MPKIPKKNHPLTELLLVHHLQGGILHAVMVRADSGRLPLLPKWGERTTARDRLQRAMRDAGLTTQAPVDFVMRHNTTMLGEVHNIAVAMLRVSCQWTLEEEFRWATVTQAEDAIGFERGTITELLKASTASEDKIDQDLPTEELPTVEITRPPMYRRLDYPFGTTPPEFPEVPTGT